MRKPFTIEEIKNSPVAPRNLHLFEQTKKVRKVRSDCKQVIWLKEQLQQWGEKNGLEIIAEYKFHEYRKWRLDFFIAEINLGIEYEGIFSGKSRHTTLTGYTGDTDKYREAAIMGIKLLRYTALNYKNLEEDLKAILI